MQQVQQVLQVLLANQSSHASQTAAIQAHTTTIQATLATQGAEQLATQQLLATMAQGEMDCPRLIWLRPAPKSTKLLSRLKRSMKPSSWLVDKYDVFFVCPVTLRLAVTGKGGNGYRVEMPKQWVRDYGPAIRASLAFLKTAVAAGRLAGLPLPTVPTLDDLAPGADCLCALTEFMDNLDSYMLDELGEAEGREGNTALVEVSQGPAVGAAYRKLKLFMESLDPGLENCGLVKVVCLEDGSVEWVGPGAAKDRFEREGRKALCSWDTARSD
uniref:Uncharacterized protein n=1 Tax=Rhizochromulina marina TaxID=1034831 RepID=A0A7S2SIY7_9STRA|mmetsp:Transcript_30637/g.89029  ORF Transcript_30637/g.89029 Transcript_30637/m.89029 type:complete len:271 (+) Transcript_30637:794-1606(+)